MSNPLTFSDPSTEIIQWKNEPNFRGTFSILTTCLSTLVICVWSSIHFDIPRQIDIPWFEKLGPRLYWVMIGLFYPEWLIVSALGQRQEAGRLQDLANKEFVFEDQDGAGFEEDLEDGTGNGEGERTQLLHAYKPRQLRRRHRWTCVHGFYAVMGGFAYETSDPGYCDYDNDCCHSSNTRNGSKVTSNQRVRIVLKPSDVEYLILHKPELIPDIPKVSISIKSKADGLAKALLFAQTSWFCVNSASRLGLGMTLTLLEVTTLAHAICSLAVYLLWWYKPLNIQEPTIIEEPDEETRARIGYGSQGDAYDFQAESPEEGSDSSFAIVLIGISWLYGLPHLLGWYTVFPTELERRVWHICACILSCSGIWAVLMMGIYDVLTPSRWIRIPKWMGSVVVFVSLVVYFLASLFLLVESFRQLFYLPPDAFDVPSWSSYLPHIS